MKETYNNKKTSPEQTSQIVRNEKAQQPKNTFDSIRQVDGLGQEYWSARDLQKVLEYSRWEKFEKVVLAVKEELEFENVDLSVNFGFTNRGSNNSKRKDQVLVDYNLSRFFCYKLAMRGETDACKKSRTYFAIQTRKQEIEKPKELSKLEWIKLALETEEARERERLEKERVKLELTETKKELEHKQDIIMERVATIPVQEIRTKLNKICRWTLQGDFQYRWRLLYKEFNYQYHKNLKELANNAGLGILDYAEKNNLLENLYNLALKLFETQRENGEKLLLN
jgi:hypothetical protein